MNDSVPLPANLRQFVKSCQWTFAKTVTPKMLRELGLLENSPSGNLLNNCWPGLD
jgi:hypothetical protein